MEGFGLPAVEAMALWDLSRREHVQVGVVPWYRRRGRCPRRPDRRRGDRRGEIRDLNDDPARRDRLAGAGPRPRGPLHLGGRGLSPWPASTTSTWPMPARGEGRRHDLRDAHDLLRPPLLRRRRRCVRRPALAGPRPARARRPTVIYCRDAFELSKAGLPPRPYEPPPGVTIHALASPFGPLSPLATHQTGKPLFKLGAIRRLLAAIRPDVVHFHNLSLIGGPGLLEIDAPGAVKLMTAHEHWLVCPQHVLWKHDGSVCESKECVRCCLRGDVLALAVLASAGGELRSRGPPRPWTP